jgi:hypothetical protein
MRNFLWLTVGMVFFGAVLLSADEGVPNLSGTWKLAQGSGEPGHASKDLVLIIEEKGESIHVKETSGLDAKNDLSDFTCNTMGKECEMLDEGHKANVSVYYNGPVLVVLKTHGRKNDSVEKRRISLSEGGNSLVVEVIHIDPVGKAEKLVFSKAQ